MAMARVAEFQRQLTQIAAVLLETIERRPEPQLIADTRAGSCRSIGGRNGRDETARCRWPSRLPRASAAR